MNFILQINQKERATILLLLVLPLVLCSGEPDPERSELRCRSVMDEHPTILCTHLNGTTSLACENCFSVLESDCEGFNCTTDPDWSCEWPEWRKTWVCEDQEADISILAEGTCPEVAIRKEYLDFKFNGKKAWVEVEKAPWFEKFELNSTTFVRVPDRALMTTGTISVVMLCGREILSSDFPIIGQVICPITDCIFCKDSITYFNCTTQSHKAMIIMISITLLLSMVAAVVAVVFLILRIRRSCKRPVLLVSLMLIIGTVQACDDVFSFQTSRESIINGTLTEETQLSITFNGIGQTKCLVMKTGNETLGNLSVRLRQHRLLFQSDFQYYTSDWTPKTAVRHRCAGTSGCYGSNKKCDFTGDCARVNGECQLKGEAVKLPGETRCQTSCGCAWCSGCGSCADSCLYSRFAVSNHKDDLRVLTPFQSRAIMSFDLNFESEENTLIESVDLSLGGSDKFGDFKVQSVGSHLDGGSFLSGDCWISGKTQDWILPCSPLNSPIGGSIGDVQYSGNSLSYPWSDVHHTRMNEDTVSFSFPAKGSRLLTSSRQLPLTRGSCLMTVWNDQLTCNWQGSVSDQVIVTLPAGLKLQSKIELCEVKAKVSETTGCSSCVEGVVIRFEITSNCATSARFESEDWIIFNQFHELSPGTQDVDVRVFTQNEHSKGEIRLVSGNELTFDLDIYAPELNRTIDNGVNRIIGRDPSGKDIVSGDFLSGIFGNLPGWSKVLIIIGLCVVGIIGLLLLVKFGPSIVSWALRRRAYSKVNSEDSVSETIELEDFSPEEVSFNDL